MTDQTTTTQARHPWRATLRTIVAAGLPLVVLLPAIVDASGVARFGWAAGLVAACGTFTRVLAVPGVNAWLAQYVPPLAAAPKSELPGE